VIDVSVRDFETVFCNADRHHLVRWTITGTRLRCRQCPTCS
jgi:hypothetical protein